MEEARPGHAVNYGREGDKMVVGALGVVFTVRFPLFSLFSFSVKRMTMGTTGHAPQTLLWMEDTLFILVLQVFK